MAIDFQRQRFTFAPFAGGPQSLEQSFTFPTQVRKAEAAINGFNIGFTNVDHELFRQEVDAAVTSVTGQTVVVRVSFALRDSSGVFDDRYDGWVEVLTIVDRA
jgi:hypothetical protein